ncbi:MAG: helix-turn-helix transcriptional regulator [Clostridia bacterium]|nr:helix-turn-helix transcriptional regulator [Clostridia bacterium]
MNSVLKSDIDKNFGKILRDFRIKNKLTQEQLSEELGISLKYISRIENGNNGIKTQTLIKYMNLLGITPNTIYKSFITNKEVIKNIDLTEKINSLSEDKKDFINSIIDLLQNMN